MDILKRKFPVAGRPVRVAYRVIDYPSDRSSPGQPATGELRLKDTLFGDIQVDLAVPPLHPGQVWEHDFVAVPPKAGTFLDSPAQLFSLQYTQSDERNEDADMKEGDKKMPIMLSSSTGVLMVLSPDDYDLYFDGHWRPWLAYLAVVAAWVFVNYYVYTQSLRQLSNQGRT